MRTTRPAFTHSSILSNVRTSFNKSIKDLNKAGNIPLSDCFMSGLAIFSLKFKSLLQFEKDKASEPDFIKHNLTPLYGVKHVPCDTYLRERLDGKFLISLDASGPDFGTFLKESELLCAFAMY